MDKFCITFAGAVGSSKSPIAHYLSHNLGLPVICNDVIRTEVLEDRGRFVEDEYVKRRDERLQAMVEGGKSFIFDASVDREWSLLREGLEKHGYRWFVISLDLSRNLLAKLYEIKGYDESMKRIDNLLSEHQKFINENTSSIGISITDDNFVDRLNVALSAVKVFLDNK